MIKNITNEDLAIMMKKGFDEIHEKFATKEDLKRFATKEDLKRFATKEDLKRFATKEDLKRFATKEDLIIRTQDLATKEELETTEAKLIKKIDDLSTKEDYTAKLMKDSYDELAASTGARIRQEDKIDKNKDVIECHENTLNNHASRITKLEFTKA